MSNSEENEDNTQFTGEESSDDELETLEEDVLLRYVWRSIALQHATNETLIRSLIQSKTLATQRIIETFRKVPRGDFILPDMQNEAYVDHPLRFSTMGFNTSAPHMFAMCLEALQLEEGHTFLDIGSGCGILTLLGALLVGSDGFALGLDIRQDIIDLSTKNLKEWKEKNMEESIQIDFELRNCFLVDTEERKWDRIHVGACCPEYRLQSLFDLLSPQGKLVTPYGDELLLVSRSEDGKSFEKKILASVRYGDLVVPSEAEVREAILLAESRRRERICVPEKTSFDEDSANLFCDEKHSDFSLIVDGKTIPAHKLILRSRCEYFDILFACGMRESSDKQIIIEDFSYEQVLAVLKVIYKGSCDINPENAVEFLEVANYFKLEWMKCQCEKVLHENIEVETASQIFAIADRFDARQLRDACLEFILKNYEQVMGTDSFQELERGLVMEVMKEACARAALSTSPKK